MKNEDFNLTLLNAARKIHHADWNWKDVNSPFARLYMVENGSAKVILPDGVHIIQPGYLYLIPAFVTHSYESDSVFIHYYFHIYNGYDIFDRWNFPFEVHSDELDVLLVKRLLAINPGIELKYSDPRTYDNFSTLTQNIAKSSQKSFIFGLETNGILNQLFSRFLDKATLKQEVSDKRIKKALRYIRENINKNLHVNDLADLCSLNRDHFTRLFKKEMQCTPMQYIIRKKIEKAQLILIASETSIKNIAYGLSFDDVTQFNRSFKKVTGISPTSYKNQYK
ncbi:MAG: Arabinose operon regulatory protein [Candidatus Ordinivivax streblomastigis]|uniref:Arabinose operon regulatory protein n=1 Tax=Candidatus Ordinivivax streblomastigis TaxID=2540710 RepID=A0A5M8NZ85_9BACT|nr:MAG: Arabinose operon regulatory protein [Candidatus Ordinivivax streblomastigis]